MPRPVATRHSTAVWRSILPPKTRRLSKSRLNSEDRNCHVCSLPLHGAIEAVRLAGGGLIFRLDRVRSSGDGGDRFPHLEIVAGLDLHLAVRIPGHFVARQPGVIKPRSFATLPGEG